MIGALMSGCGDDASREGRPAARPAPPAITDAANGRSFTLSQGAETALRLPGGYEWGEPAVRGQAVELIRVDYFQDPGFSEWTVRAVQPGTATIAAHGTRDGRGAPLDFRVEITVSQR
jgi:hypothetical protein